MEHDYTENYASLHGNLRQLSPDGAEIRLVVLRAGQPSDELICSLVVASFRESKYEALSYTWQNVRIAEGWEDSEDAENAEDTEEWEDVGDSANDEGPDGEEVDLDENQSASRQGSESEEEHEQTPQVPIFVNDLLVNVMPNLADALRHLRRPDKERTLWIDYLCINQGSDLDRTTEVRRMNEIYARAFEVIVWLGLEEEDSQQGLFEVVSLTSNMHLSQLYASDQAQGNLIERLKPLVHLLSRPWFQRVWVAQEVGLAQEAVVQVGSRTLPWISFLQAARTFRDHLSCCSDVIWPFLRDLDGDYWLKLRAYWSDVLAFDATQKDFLTLHEALRLFHGRRATDPRDKVFGILGLLNPSERLVVPNYSLSASEIYQQTAVAIIIHSQNLSVLIDIDEYAGDVDVPSWCVDWTTGTVFGLDLYTLYNAGGNTTATAFVCSKDTLRVKGIVMDEVLDVINSPYEDTNSTVEDDLLIAIGSLYKWEQLAGLSLDPSSPYPSGGAVQDALYQTTLMGVSADRSRRLRSNDYAAYKTWRKWLDVYFKKSIHQRPPYLQDSIRKSNIREHNEILASYPAVRWFFTTRTGYMGLGPLEMEKGDTICVLAGGGTPFILRGLDEKCEACGGGEACWRLMGYAFVHGLMDGEAVALVKEGKKEWQNFCLR